MFSLFGKSKEDYLFSHAEKGKVSKMVELIEEGAPIDIFQKNTGCTPLFVAAKNGKYDCVKELLRKGANPNLGIKGRPKLSDEKRNKNTDEFYNIIDNISGRLAEGTTPLVGACQRNHYQVAKLLIENGADLNHINEDGNGPLHAAIINKHMDIARLLLDAGANVDLPLGGDSTLLLGCSHLEDMNIDIFKMLIEYGANVNIECDEVTPLSAACGNGRIDIAELLIENGADINMKTKRGAAAIHAAIHENFASLVQYLIDNGANIDVEGINKFTPLQLAAAFGNLDIVKILVKAGADIKKKNPKYNVTAIEMALEEGHRKVEKYLRKELNG